MEISFPPMYEASFVFKIMGGKRTEELHNNRQHPQYGSVTTS